MIRPEIWLALHRWRDALAGGALAALGLYWGLARSGLVFWIGWVLFLLGFLLLISGLQRGRARQGSGGPGVVQITEAQIGYFGPETGGLVALDLLDEIHLGGTPSPVWRFVHRGGPPLEIPVDALGADRLYDTVAQLPALDTGVLARALAHPSEEERLIWRRKRGDVRQLT